jgi:hypothetical protein
VSDDLPACIEGKATGDVAFIGKLPMCMCQASYTGTVQYVFKPWNCAYAAHWHSMSSRKAAKPSASHLQSCHAETADHKGLHLSIIYTIYSYLLCTLCDAYVIITLLMWPAMTP